MVIPSRPRSRCRTSSPGSKVQTGYVGQQASGACAGWLSWTVIRIAAPRKNPAKTPTIEIPNISLSLYSLTLYTSLHIRLKVRMARRTSRRLFGIVAYCIGCIQSGLRIQPLHPSPHTIGTSALQSPDSAVFRSCGLPLASSLVRRARRSSSSSVESSPAALGDSN